MVEFGHGKPLNFYLLLKYFEHNRSIKDKLAKSNINQS